MNRATLIEKLTDVQRNVQRLLDQLQASEHDKFVAHLYQARKQYRLVCERPNKGNTAIEREVISSYQVAQRLGFKTATSEPGSTCCGFWSEGVSAAPAGSQDFSDCTQGTDANFGCTSASGFSKAGRRSTSRAWLGESGVSIFCCAYLRESSRASSSDT
jgi:hypothetical protein